MKYMGSKKRIAKYIIPLMLSEANKIGFTTWVEPFVGGGNIIESIPSEFKKTGFDVNPHTIKSLIDIRDNLNNIPEYVSEETFKSYKGRPAETITSFVRTTSAYSGLFGNVMARGSNRNYALEAKNNAIKQSLKIQDVNFECNNYINLDFENCVIYCDPPYKGARKYPQNEIFDYDKFYEWCLNQSRNNLIFISEYNMPNQFRLVWEGDVTTTNNNVDGKSFKAREKLFTI